MSAINDSSPAIIPMPPELKSRLRAVAWERRTSMAVTVRAAISAFLDELDGEKQTGTVQPGVPSS